MFENTKRILDRCTELGVPSNEVLVYHEGKEVFHEARGVRDSDGNPIRRGEMYNIYSCSKPITCAAALTLVESGKLSLDDDLANYIPAFGDVTVNKNGGNFKAENKIKISHLFTMTAGLGYNMEHPTFDDCRRDTDGASPTVKAMDYVARIPLDFEPGQKWQYSLCHDVLAAVVEIVSGKRFGLYVKEKIFDPLGMKNSTFLLPEELVSTLPAQYRGLPKGKGVTEIDKQIYRYKIGREYESGGAGCITTADDYLKFLEGMRTDKVLSREMRELMYTDRMTEEQRAGWWVARGYGYGLGVRVPDASGLRTDIGWGGAAGAYLALDEKRAISLYYAQHVLNSPGKDLRKDIIEAVKLDLGFDAFVEDMYHGEASHLA